MPHSNHPNQLNQDSEAPIDESGAIEELTDDDLEDVAGGCGRGRMRRRGRNGRRASQTSFAKRSLSVSGQTIVKPDGSSVTSFSMQLEEITSQVSEVIDIG